MANSVVYRDGDNGLVALVAHGSDNPLRRGSFELTGLMHYCADKYGDVGSFEIFDGATDTFYALDKHWDGVDWEVLFELNRGLGDPLDFDYYETIDLYSRASANEIVRESLA